jgi:Tol biopolymer transport system component
MVRGKGVARALLALGALLALAPTAQAQYFGQNKIQYRSYDWHSITSDHFEVYTYDGLDSLAIRVLDLAEKTNQVLSQRLGHSLGRRVPIILYGSHNDFAQTNVTPELIDQSTGGFTEVLRNRVVLPFTGSYEDLRHVVVHELTHAYMFDLLYGGSAASMIAGQTFYSVPLWFAEGLAEYESLGMESNAEMFLRDGVIDGELPPLAYAGGYIVYKQGQSAISFFVDRYGEDRLRELLRRIRQMRGFDRAFERAAGTSVAKFDEQWRSWLRKRYWPTVATKQDPESFARRLTDHRADLSYLNSAPSISPQGDRIAYFSDRRQYTDVYLMSAIDGKILHRIIRGERNVKFESIPLLRSSIAWSPEGERLALVAKSEGRDVLYIVAAKDGRVLERFKLPCDALAFPAWSPVADSIAVTGLAEGHSDLWLVNAHTKEVTRLTNDIYDEKQPVWTPDGKRLTFASDRLAPVILYPVRNQKAWGRYGIFSLDLASREVTKLVDTAGDDGSPAWSPAGDRLAFVSDRTGTPNLYLYTPADGLVTQLTDVVGGVSVVSWSRQNDRLVFSAYNHSGVDIFSVKEPLSLDAVVARLRRHAPQTVMSLEAARETPADSTRPAPVRGALAATWPDSLSMPKDTLTAVAPGLGGEASRRDTLRLTPPRVPEPPAWSAGGMLSGPPPPLDTLKPLPTVTALVDRGGPFELPDSLLAQRPAEYHARLGLDYAGSTLIAATGYGFAGTAAFQFSDFLRNHSLFVATDLFGGSIEETNALVLYDYLPRRWDFEAGAFHFTNYFSGRVTTLGEQLASPQLFSERTFGGLVGVAYPFDRFRRIELNYTQMFLERKFYDQDIFGDFFVTGRQYRSITSPGVSLVTDNTLWGYYGPVNGQRSNLTYSPALPVFPNALAYQSVLGDWRRYWDLTHGYTVAVRMLGSYSGGRDPQIFRAGGFSTLRGYSDFDLLGSRLAITNVEVRFPFIQQLGLVGPLPIGFFNLRGAVFGDAGLIWNDDAPLRWEPLRTAVAPQNGYAVGFGTGVRSSVFGLILKLDTGWSTDFHGVSRPRWHFSIGPEF